MFEESTLNIHIPSIPILLVVTRILISSEDLRFKERRSPSPPSIPTCERPVWLSVHCMSSYRKVTNESWPSVARIIWNVFFCNKELIVVSYLLSTNLIGTPIGKDLKPRYNEQGHRSEGRLQGRKGSPHFTGISWEEHKVLGLSVEYWPSPSWVNICPEGG